MYTIFHVLMKIKGLQPAGTMNISWNATRKQKVIRIRSDRKLFWIFHHYCSWIVTLTCFWWNLIFDPKRKRIPTRNIKLWWNYSNKKWWKWCLQLGFCKKLVWMISNELAKVSSLYKIQGVHGKVHCPSKCFVRFGLYGVKWP